MSFWSRLFRRPPLIEQKMLSAPSIGIEDALAAFGATTSDTRSDARILSAFGRVPRLYQIADRVAQTVASIPWRAYREKHREMLAHMVRTKDFRGMRKAEEQGELQEVPDHPLIRLLSNPNPIMTAQEFRACVQVHLDLPGRSYLLLERGEEGKREPFEIYPIPPHWLSRAPSMSSKTYEFRGEGKQITNVRADDVIHWRRIDPSDPFSGAVGLGKTLGDEIDIDEYAAKTAKNRFENNAIPEAIITVEGSEALGKDVEKKWFQRFRGHRKVGLPIITSQQVKIHQAGANWVDLKLIEQRNAQADTIREVFGVPPEVFGIVENSNRATITQSEILMARYVTIPRLENWFAMLNTRLLPLFNDRDVVIMFESPDPSDWDYVLEAAQAAPWALSVDEWRSLQNLPPLENDAGKVHAIPLAIEFGDLSEKPFASEQVEGVDEWIIEEKSMIKTRKRAQKIVDKAVRAKDYQKKMTPLWTDSMGAWAEVFTKKTGLKVDLPAMKKILISSELKNFALSESQINDTTRTRIRDQLVEGMMAGESIDALSARVRKSSWLIDENRAKMIARTEVNRASNWGAWIIQKNADVKMKMWVSLGDDHVRPSHKSLHGQRRGINNPFKSPSGATGQYPGGMSSADENVLCRCTTIPIAKPKKLDDAIDEQEGALADLVWKAFDAFTRDWELASLPLITAVQKEQTERILALLKDETREAEDPETPEEEHRGNGSAHPPLI